MSVEYAKDRVQFGRPIGSFQAIKHKCAEVLVDVEGARSPAHYGGWAASHSPEELPLVACVAKATASEAFFHAAGENVQIHGGIGCTWEHDAHLYLKRAKTSGVLLGDARALAPAPRRPTGAVDDHERRSSTSVRDGVATITLNRPEHMNTMGDGLVEQTAVALAQAAEDDAVRAVILTGTGRAFCAGGDLRGFAAGANGRRPTDGRGVGRESARAHADVAAPARDAQGDVRRDQRRLRRRRVVVGLRVRHPLLRRVGRLQHGVHDRRPVRRLRRHVDAAADRRRRPRRASCTCWPRSSTPPRRCGSAWSARSCRAMSCWRSCGAHGRRGSPASRR